MKPKILCVDDSRALRTGMKNWLHPNYDVVGIPDGQQALTLLEETTFDLIILDLDMPNMTGEDTIRELRARGDQTPVVLLTAESRTSNIQRVMQHGVLDYILKPCSPPDLKQKLEAALRTAYDQKLQRAQEEANEDTIAAAKVQAGGEPQPSIRPAGATVKTKSKPNTKSTSTASVKPGEAPAAKEQSSSLLMIDDMKSVSRALRRHVDDSIRIGHATTKEAAVNTCSKRDYKMIMVDMDIPRVDSISLGAELKKLQPKSKLVALYLANQADPKAQAKTDGFDAFITKPFDGDEVKELIETAFGDKDYTELTDNVVTFQQIEVGDANPEALMADVRKQLMENVKEVASAACFACVILDLRNGLPTDTLGRFLAPVIELCGALRIGMKVVGDEKVQQAMQATLEGDLVSVVSDLAEAKSA
ncbi:MAG: response regulator [Deltaproteobacteria bacterium]|jgi:DNA-binding response OmpR family regulator|nr:response regulator [Deltaproteobacteria bacterium]MBT6436354.1 response regulator [Deltaproteobacteria bacterium]MBT6491200.1 response regulator [Deltaproteobacteria bacterium]